VAAGSSTSNGVGEGKIIVDGGRYVGSSTTAASSLLFGNAAYSNVIASVVLTNGASWVQGANVSFSAANAGTSVETLDIYKNSSFQATYITATAVAALTYGVNVKGGDLILTQAAENSALQSAAKIYFDAGTIKFTGVDTLTDYNTFTNSWNTWVDNGMITSTAGYTASQLKGALSFDGTDAIATIQPRLRTIKLFIIR
jgi:D-arabinose 1-dehydrogenase-like Zn-dependent alcohol dehydrogenase